MNVFTITYNIEWHEKENDKKTRIYSREQQKKAENVVKMCILHTNTEPRD